ncbi:MAG: TonB family protein [Desulfobacteraceae bacterium]|nr:TonB family protein [Desulfobacteraceae bacterium]
MDASYLSNRSRGTLGDDQGCNGGYGIALYVFSLVLHLVFLLGLFFYQDMSPRRVMPPSIKVDLVSLDLPGPSESSQASAVEPVAKERKAPEPAPEPVPAPVKPVVEKAPVVKKTVRVIKPEAPPKAKAKPKPGKKKRALKKKTYRADKVLSSARKTMEKNIAQSAEKKAQDALGKAFSRLAKEVEKKGGSRPLANVSGSGAKGDRSDYTAIDLYNLELMYRIRQNWAFSERLAKADKALEARVLIKILKNGQIRDVWFETRSGNHYLDESALKAVKKSSPLPPLPKGYTSYEIGLKFTPSGLK